MSNSRGANSPGRSSSDVGGAQGAICVKTRGGRFCCFYFRPNSFKLVTSDYISNCSAVIFNAK